MDFFEAIEADWPAAVKGRLPPSLKFDGPIACADLTNRSHPRSSLARNLANFSVIIFDPFLERTK